MIQSQLQPSSLRPPTNSDNTLSSASLPLCQECAPTYVVLRDSNICNPLWIALSEEVRPLHLCGLKYPLPTVKFPALLRYPPFGCSGQRKD